MVGVGKAKRGKGGGIEARQNDKTVIEVFSYAVVWWGLMGLSRVVGGGVGEGVSRRFVSPLSLLFVSNSAYLGVNRRIYPTSSGYPLSTRLLYVDTCFLIYIFSLRLYQRVFIQRRLG